MLIDEKLKELGIKLQEVQKPKFSYIPAVQTGNLVYVSGQDCRIDGKLLYEGYLGKDLTIEEGQKAARQCAINCLSVLKWKLGDLNKIKRIVKLLGFVQSAAGFQSQPYVMNGASDLFSEVFGENGNHARSAIGTNELPFNTPVEIEIIVETF